MISYDFLNTEKTKRIYWALKELDKINNDKRTYCSEARLVTELILRYVVECCGIEPAIQSGKNLDTIRRVLPSDILREEIKVEFSNLLNITNRYHHYCDDIVPNPHKDYITVRMALEKIIPWLRDIEKTIKEYLQEKDRRENRRLVWGLVGGFLGLLGLFIGSSKSSE